MNADGKGPLTIINIQESNGALEILYNYILRYVMKLSN